MRRWEERLDESKERYYYEAVTVNMKQLRTFNVVSLSNLSMYRTCWAYAPQVATGQTQSELPAAGWVALLDDDGLGP